LAAKYVSDNYESQVKSATQAKEKYREVKNIRMKKLRAAKKAEAAANAKELKDLQEKKAKKKAKKQAKKKEKKEKKKAAKKKKKDATKDATTDATKDATKDVTGRVRLTRAAKTQFVKRFNQEVPKDNRTEEIIALRAKLAEVDPKPANEAELVAFLNPRIKADGYWIKESKLPGAGYGLFTLKARKVGGDGPVYCGEIQKGIPSPDKDR
jgi:membrane protein involved in colicin uptake